MVCLLGMEKSTRRDLGENVPKKFFPLCVPLPRVLGEDGLGNLSQALRYFNEGGSACGGGGGGRVVSDTAIAKDHSPQLRGNVSFDPAGETSLN